ncbi:9440_t:CDS:2, partial [Racocetra fulgida]
GNKAVKVRNRVQRTSYKASEKLTVIQEAEKIGVLAAARHFGIDQSMISQWICNKEKYINTSASNRRIGARRVSFYPAAEKELVKWLNDLHQTGIAVTAAAIKMQMVNILSTTCANKYPDAAKQFLNDNDDLIEIVEEDSLSAEELDITTMT